MAMDPDTLAQLCATLRRFVDEQLIPAEAEVAETDAIPERIVAGMRELGLFGLTAPEEYGGLGLTMEEEVMAIFELGRAAPAFRSMFATNVGIGMQGIAIDGTPEQKAKYLPRLASGELIGSFALTEPDVGSDAGSVKATARRDGDFYVLNGTKRFITNAPTPGCSPSWRAPIPGRRALPASRPLRSSVTRPACPWASRKRRWASRAPMSAT